MKKLTSFEKRRIISFIFNNYVENIKDLTILLKNGDKIFIFIDEKEKEMTKFLYRNKETDIEFITTNEDVFISFVLRQLNLQNEFDIFYDSCEQCIDCQECHTIPYNYDDLSNKSVNYMCKKYHLEIANCIIPERDEEYLCELLRPSYCDEYKKKIKNR